MPIANGTETKQNAFRSLNPQTDTVAVFLATMGADGTIGKIPPVNLPYSIFTPITENQYGIHPAFDNQNDLNAWLLGNFISADLTYLNAPEPISAVSDGYSEITINCTDTNS